MECVRAGPCCCCCCCCVVLVLLAGLPRKMGWSDVEDVDASKGIYAVCGQLWSGNGSPPKIVSVRPDSVADNLFFAILCASRFGVRGGPMGFFMTLLDASGAALGGYNQQS